MSISDIGAGIAGGLIGGTLAGFATDAINSLTGKASSRLFHNENFNIVLPCTISEAHSDTLTVTDHPVERGTVISDHAYLNPQRVDITVAHGASSGQSLRDIYAMFLTLQASRELFNITTGKRLYANMLIESIEEQTDVNTENILILTLRCREIIIVETQVVQPPVADQNNGQSTAEPSEEGDQQMQEPSFLDEAGSWFQNTVADIFP